MWNFLRLTILFFPYPSGALRFASTPQESLSQSSNKALRTSASEVSALLSNHRNGRPTSLYGVPVDLKKDLKVDADSNETWMISLTKDALLPEWTNFVPSDLFVVNVLPSMNSFIAVSSISGVAKELSVHDVSMVAAISQDVFVAVPEPNSTNSTGYTTGSCASSAWGLDRIDQVDLSFDNEYDWESDYPDGGAGANVYVFDTGVNVNNGDFGGRAINRFECLPSKDYSVCEAVASCTDNDAHGHGTHVAGIVAGVRYGVAKHATVHGMRVVDASGGGTISGVINAMDRVVDSAERQIFQMSIASYGNHMWDNAVNLATDQFEVVVVVAAGNNGGEACSYSPGRASSSLNVGSHDLDDGISWFSNTGSCVDVYAPGNNIRSASHDGACSSECMTGTSMAAPHACGVVALARGYCPSIHPSAVRDFLPTWGKLVGGTRRLHLGSTVLVDQTLKSTECGVASKASSWSHCPVPSPCPTPAPDSTTEPLAPTTAPGSVPAPTAAGAPTDSRNSGVTPTPSPTPDAHAIGDPHIQNVMGEHFDLWKTGWSSFLQVPLHFDEAEPQLLLQGNVERYWGDECAPAFLQQVSISGERLGHNILVESGSLESSKPFSVKVDTSPLVSIHLNGTTFLDDERTTVLGVISSPNPEEWGPDAQLFVVVGNLTIDIRQHTEGRLEKSRSMLDLVVHGLDGEQESMGGWFGVDGPSEGAGEAPPGCERALLIQSQSLRRTDPYFLSQ